MSDNEVKFRAWVEEHPDGRQTDCVSDTGLSKSTVHRYWKSIRPGIVSDSTPTEPAHTTTAPASAPTLQARSERMTIMMAPQTKRRLRLMCADADITAADWIDNAINSAYETWTLTK